jgi:hypothetical protein
MFSRIIGKAQPGIRSQDQQIHGSLCPMPRPIGRLQMPSASPICLHLSTRRAEGPISIWCQAAGLVRDHLPPARCLPGDPAPTHRRPLWDVGRHLAAYQIAKKSLLSPIDRVSHVSFSRASP